MDYRLAMRDGANDRVPELYVIIQLDGIMLNKSMLLWTLKEYGSTGAVSQGKLIHDQIVRGGLEVDVVTGSILVDMYVKCGSLEEARKVFDELHARNVVSWGAMIGGYADHGLSLPALELYDKMQDAGITPDRFIYPCVLKACGRIGSFAKGKLIHEQVVSRELESELVIGSALVDMYAKCRSLEEAHLVFDNLPSRNVVTWGAMIAGYTEHGCGFSVLELCEKMALEGLMPNEITWLSILKACGKIGALQQGNLAHEQIIKSGLEGDTSVGNTLVDLYTKCGSLQEAQNVFDKLQRKTVVSWGAIISGYTEHGQLSFIFDSFKKLQREGIIPNTFIFSCIVKACCMIGAIKQGRLIHDQITRNGLETDVIIGSSLIDMYAKCGDLVEARETFDKLQNRDVVSWDVMIGGYAGQGQSLLAVELFEKMKSWGTKPNKATYLNIIKACGDIGALRQAQLLHKQIIESGIEIDVVIGSSLTDMYAKCGSLEAACEAFDKSPNQNVISWSAVVKGYAYHGNGFHAFKFFTRMQQEGIEPDKVAFLSALKAVSSTRSIAQGKLLHEMIIKGGLESGIEIGNALIDMYAKCGNLEESCIVFENLSYRDPVTWGAMIGGYALQGYILTAFGLLEAMQQEGIQPDRATLLSVMKACSSIGALRQGKLMHNKISHRELDLEVTIGNTLIDMYCKCGSLKDACKVFHDMPKRDLVSWGAMIAGYAHCGHSAMAWECLEEMQQQGIKPDSMVYTRILSACSHAGQFESACQYFRSMREDHGIMPTIEHFNCMVDLLSHAGCLEEAELLLHTMPIQPDVSGWMSLLTACRAYGNTELARVCFNELFVLDPNFSAGYVVMVNIYADGNHLDNAHNIQEVKNETRAWKKPGKAWIEGNHSNHEFVVGDESHSQCHQIHACINRLKGLIKGEGYIPKLDSVTESKS